MPTPRPIITASVVVKSGMDTTWLTSVMTMAPVAMPARAVPTGRPMASTEPKATMRMKMAKARPSVSDEGGSNEPNMSPPNSICTPLIVRRRVLDLLADVGGLVERQIRGHLDAGVGDGAVLGDLVGRCPGRTGW